jgi:carbon-monoxide dehydrogenase small subunit
MEIKLKVNDKNVTLEINATMRLIDILRDQLNLTGTKEGCGVGECGACTVILNGETVCSCLVMAAQCEGAEVETIENLAKNNTLSKLQQAFLHQGGVQCGYCTPGMLMSAKALLDTTPHPSDEEIKTALEGNLCRCTGYTPIMESVKAVI